jgi:hypothetical protein
MRLKLGNEGNDYAKKPSHAIVPLGWLSLSRKGGIYEFGYLYMTTVLLCRPATSLSMLLKPVLPLSLYVSGV